MKITPKRKSWQAFQMTECSKAEVIKACNFIQENMREFACLAQIFTYQNGMEFTVGRNDWSGELQTVYANKGDWLVIRGDELLCLTDEEVKVFWNVSED